MKSKQNVQCFCRFKPRHFRVEEVESDFPARNFCHIQCYLILQAGKAMMNVVTVYDLILKEGRMQLEPMKIVLNHRPLHSTTQKQKHLKD